MVIYVKQIREKKRQCFMTTREVTILWKYVNRWSSKFSLLVAFQVFRGLRVGEACAINLNDFTPDLKYLTLIFEKSHVQDKLPLPDPLISLTRSYIVQNAHLLKDGYLFPYYSSKRTVPHLSTPVACALFSKLRKIIGRDHPEFLDVVSMRNNGTPLYRIGTHSLRRWFETHIYNNRNDMYLIRDIMRYSDVKTVNTYIKNYEVWKQERAMMNELFIPVYDSLTMGRQGQKKLFEY